MQWKATKLLLVSAIKMPSRLGCSSGGDQQPYSEMVGSTFSFYWLPPRKASIAYTCEQRAIR